MAPEQSVTPSVACVDPVVSIAGLHKRFGGTAALRGVDLTVSGGEIHAFLGANGAGKSTLIKILAGVHKPDEGQISIGSRSLQQAVEAGRLSFVHQDLGLIDTMSIGENMAMTYGYPMRLGIIDWRAVDNAATSSLAQLGWPLPLDRLVGELSQAEKSIVAIARALTGDIDVLILDEPTASLPESDVERLFEALRTVRARQIAIIYVTHRLDEVFRLADAVTVLRDGRVVASYRPLSTLSSEQLVRDICGRLPQRTASGKRPAQATPALRIADLCVGPCGPVSFEIGPNEIVGLAGLRGQGHESIGRAIAGVEQPSSGSIEVGAQQASYHDPRGAIAAGIGFTSGKRAEESLATNMSVRENLFLNPLNFGRRALTIASSSVERREARRVLERFDVQPRDPDRDISTLSGGNQQKVVLARSANRGFRLLVLEEPTIGVDIGAKAEIYSMLTQGAARGTPCVIVSSDLVELAQICHRVLAFGAGRIVAELEGSDLSIETLTHAVSSIVPSALAS
jgi:ribose transport system ATP-binding protein